MPAYFARLDAWDHARLQRNKMLSALLWKRKIAEPAKVEMLSFAPVIICDLAIVAKAGGEFIWFNITLRVRTGLR
jgi:hypothetical protein